MSGRGVEDAAMDVDDETAAAAAGPASTAVGVLAVVPPDESATSDNPESPPQLGQTSSLSSSNSSSPSVSVALSSLAKGTTPRAAPTTSFSSLSPDESAAAATAATGPTSSSTVLARPRPSLPKATTTTAAAENNDNDSRSRSRNDGVEQYGARNPTPSLHSLSHAYHTYLQHDIHERNHFDDVCQSYRQYATFAMAQWANHQYRLQALSDDQRAFLPPALQCSTAEYHERSRLYKEATIRNQFVLDCVLRHAGQPHSQQQSNALSQPPSDSQMAKVSSVLKSLVRDWSKEGHVERDQAYQPLLQLVQQYVPLSPPAASKALSSSSSMIPRRPSLPPPRLCVPGAGVGRLALELASLGYEVQGNEFSLHMLLASDFILNGGIATPDHPMRISPYLLETRNVHSATDPFRAIAIPDVDPYSLLLKEEKHKDGAAAALSSPQPEFSMAAGEFVSIYSAPREKGKWNGVVACFFLDNAPCVVEYLQVAYDMLAPGGVLLHFGPLLWHWSGPAFRPDDASFDDYQQRYHHLDPKYLSSIDLCWEDIQAVLVNIGFELVESKTGQTANYTADSRSMMKVEYRCLQFVARKPAKAVPDDDFDL